MNETRAPRDALTSLAPMLRVRPELQDYCRFGGDWCARHDPEESGWAAFHIVLKGSCVVERAGQAPVALQAGDVLLLPHGDGHVVFGGDDRAAFRPIHYSGRDTIRLKQTEGVPIDTELVCGRLHLESSSENLVLRTLPRAVLLTLGGIDGCLGLIGLIVAELEQDRAGSAAITRDLASAMFVMLLRRCFETLAPAEGLLALLAARETAKAAAAMLEDPARLWELDELAAIAAVSRPSLVRAFRRITGLPPFGFLTELRLGIARHRIMDTAEPLAQIAADAGYQSEAALSRAFLRRFDIRPGALRKAAQHDQAKGKQGKGPED
ncbi:AraC family transcriptional regulator [Novosphingobium sp.]|uniref:AraC family transcriptional regulator n=1 Tax=Novosphingobium sp. TaxID=1874826 RepID=UPI0031DE5163